METEITMKVKLLVGCLIVAFIVVGVAPTRAIAQTEGAKGIPPSWLQVNADGFGEYNWQIPSLVGFGKYLYAGTWWMDWGSGVGKAQIWRTADDENWQKVFEADENGAAALVVFKEYLYCGSWGEKIWRSKDGVNWKEVVPDGFGDINNGIARMVVYNNTLYASTWNWATGTEIWSTTNGKTWNQVVNAGLSGDPNNGGAIASEVFQGHLYWGICCNATGAQLWRTDGKTTEALVIDGFGNPHNIAISSLAAFGGYLYAGAANDWGVVQVWRSVDGTNWTQVYVSDDTILGAVNAMEVYHGQLYLVMENYNSGTVVYRTSNGNYWEQVGFDGFGDGNNVTTYWDNGTTIYREGLYIATTNWGAGGEVWKLVP
jgi:hypothetical protein